MRQCRKCEHDLSAQDRHDRQCSNCGVSWQSHPKKPKFSNEPKIPSLDNTAARVFLREATSEKRADETPFRATALLEDLKGAKSDADKCVQLAAAKLAHDGTPDGRGGDRSKVQRSDFAPFVRLAEDVLRWKRASIYSRIRIGLSLGADAYTAMRGTSLAESLGDLRMLCELADEEQAEISRQWAISGVEKVARAKLKVAYRKLKGIDPRRMSKKDAERMTPIHYDTE